LYRNAAFALSALLGPKRNAFPIDHFGSVVLAMYPLLSASQGVNANRPRQSPRSAKDF
jgi:hypothetical protein